MGCKFISPLFVKGVGTIDLSTERVKQFNLKFISLNGYIFDVMGAFYQKTVSLEGYGVQKNQ